MASQIQGIIEGGNIDLARRPVVKNADGTISTVRSMGVNIDGQEVLIPTVSDDGRILSPQQAIQAYRQTGRHLGKFDTPEASTNYAQSLHQAQEERYTRGVGSGAPESRRTGGTISRLMDILQGASNASSSTVSAPVDGLSWLLRKAGYPIGSEPVGGSEWMRRVGLTAEPRILQRNGQDLP